jgi:hypothetical protein
MKMWNTLHAGMWVCVAAIITRGAEIFISPAGNDAGAGTITAPLATLAAARDKADVLKANNTAVTVYLRGGTYYLSAPVVFGPSNSGTATAPILYTAYGSEKPVISGGIKVSSSWTAYSGSIMVTTIAQNLKVDQLFLNGKRQVLARFPNFDPNTAILDGFDANCLSRVGNWANPAEGPGDIRGLHSNMWGGNSYKITGKSGTSITQQWVGDNNRGSGLHATYRMVENIYEELDAPGEWFYRKSTGQLFFWPPAGTTLSTATIELASQDELLRFVGTAASSAGSARYIEFKGITFTHTFRTLFSKPYETVLKSDWGIARSGTVFMQNAENISIDSCLFDQVGGNGVFLSGYNRSHVIIGNTFNDGGASCVAIMGLNSAVRCPNSWSSTPICTDRTKGPLTNEYPAFITVAYNMMNHLGRFEKQPAGIALSRTECDTLRHNTIHDCPRAGICFTDGCWGGHIVEYNWIYNDVLETGDHGPFNAWGRDRNERWKNDTSATTLDAWKTTIVRNNRFESKPGNFGIDLDDQASNYMQYNNLLVGGGLKLQWHRYNTYLNNVLVSGADAQIHGLWNGSQNYFARNIMTSSRCYYIGFYSASSANQNVDSVAHNVGMIDSNCLVANPSVGTDRGAPAWSYWISKGLDVHSVTGDPQFTDVNKTWPNYAPKGDYTVKSGSPALRIGFKNFPMDSFGVMPLPATGVIDHQARAVQSTLLPGSAAIRCSRGRLAVSQEGDYTLTITTALGRTVAGYTGKGNAEFTFGRKMTGGGIYFAILRSNGGQTISKFIMN